MANKQETYSITTGGPELLDAIEPLWLDLIALHAQKSVHFSEAFKTVKFSDRKQGLLDKPHKGKLRIALCMDSDKRIVGYCVSSVVDAEGEIESLFVNEDYRGKGLGAALVQDSMDWLQANGSRRIKAAVAYGNESVFPFYAKFGLLPRTTIVATQKLQSDRQE